MAEPRIGGSFAPPLSDESLATYKSMIDGLPSSPVKDAMATLHKCCSVWWGLPEPSGRATRPHPVGIGRVINLDPDHKTALADHIPWDEDLFMIQVVFDKIPNDTQKPLRDAAFHLLWHVKELNLDREPLTHDKL